MDRPDQVLSHSAGFSANVVQTAANKGVLLALVAMAQTFVVLTAGIDLSVGAVFILANCLSSWIVVGSPATTLLGIAGVLAAGLACGAVNGALVILGRLQPIVATLATGGVYFGLALALRPDPGGDVNADLADAVTGQLPGGIPASLLLLAVIVVLIWLPFRRSVLGRAVYPVGFSEIAAYMSGVPIRRARFLAYALSGLFAALGGLMLTFFTYSGEASAANASTYTLNSIAAVVIGGVSLFGGTGSAVGAFIFRTINEALAIPFGVLCGLGFGLVNGFGVAWLRVPSMIFTLGINAVGQGLMVVRTGGSAPQDMATPAMHALATGQAVAGVPNPVWIWAAIAVGTSLLLTRTTFGRSVYGIGNREKAAYLSGIRTRRIILAAFALSGALSGFGGVLLAGYSSKAFQGMGDPYLLPTIAAVVLGGTSILGGRGSMLGTMAGVILITLLQSILLVMQIAESGRQVIYDGVIIIMMLLYGRGARVTG